MKKAISLLIIFCIIFSTVLPAYAESNGTESIGVMPLDGFSYGYSKTNPYSSGGYGAYSDSRKGNVIFETVLASMLVSGITDAIMAPVSFRPSAKEVAEAIAKFASGAGSSWALTSTKVFYKLSTAYHTQLPGFYQKLRYEWYTDSSYSTKICTTYVYRYKA